MSKLQAVALATLMLTGAAIVPAAAQDTAQTCRNAGNSYTVGELACIPACHGAQRLARCDVAAGGTTWTYISDVCPSARLSPLPPDDASRVPVLVAMSPRPIPVNMTAIAPDMLQRLAANRMPQPAIH